MYKSTINQKEWHVASKRFINSPCLIFQESLSALNTMPAFNGPFINVPAQPKRPCYWLTVNNNSLVCIVSEQNVPLFFIGNCVSPKNSIFRDVPSICWGKSSYCDEIIPWIMTRRHKSQNYLKIRKLSNGRYRIRMLQAGTMKPKINYPILCSPGTKNSRIASHILYSCSLNYE